MRAPFKQLKQILNRKDSHRIRIAQRLASRLIAWSTLTFSFFLATQTPQTFASGKRNCTSALQTHFAFLRDEIGASSPFPRPNAPLQARGDRSTRATHRPIEEVDLRRLINEEDWSRAVVDPAHATKPWLLYGETTARDWMDTARWIADGADARPIDIELLQDIHRRAMRNHFFTGAVNRRIVADARANGIPSDQFLVETRRVIAERSSSRFPDQSIFRGVFRSDAVDDLPHDGSIILAGNRRVFSREEYEAMLRNPYITRDTTQAPEFLPDGTVRARFRYVPPARVEQVTRNILDQLNRDLASARTQEDVILAVVRMNRQLLAAHPFQDGNGRSIRLLGDLVFQRYGLPPPLYPNERDLEIVDSEAVQFILRGMRDYITQHGDTASSARAALRDGLSAPSLERSSAQISARFETHVMRGELNDKPNGERILAGGMHSPSGLQEVVQHTRARIAPLPTTLARSLPEDLTSFRDNLPIRTEVLGNGVTRAYIPRSLMNKDGWSKAASSIGNSSGALDDIIRASGLDPTSPGIREVFQTRTAAGIAAIDYRVIPYVPKSLFPANWDLNRISSAARTIVQQNPVQPLSGGSDAYEGVIDGVRMRVLVSRRTGEIETAYPTWEQP